MDKQKIEFPQPPRFSGAFSSSGSVAQRRCKLGVVISAKGAIFSTLQPIL